jgi:hypothetical protein
MTLVRKARAIPASKCVCVCVCVWGGGGNAGCVAASGLCLLCNALAGHLAGTSGLQQRVPCATHCVWGAVG